MAVDNHQTHTSQGAGDDLREIYGVGPKLAQALRQIGVDTFVQLAAYTPEDLSQVLRDQADMQMPVSRIQANNLLGQAVELAQKQARTPPRRSRSDAASDGEWRQHAGFSLFFDRSVDEQGVPIWETRIWKTELYHNETGDEETFSEAKPVAWVPWIVGQAQLPVALKELDAAAAPVVEESPGVQLDIEEVHGEKVSFAAKPVAGPAAEQITVRVSFRVAGDDINTQLDQPATYQVDVCLLSPLRRELLQMMAVRGQLQPGQRRYQHSFQLSLPPSGSYELDVIAFLLPPAPDTLAHRTVPLHVTPIFA